MSERLRLFFALWPDDFARTALAAAAAAAQAQCGGRATPPEKIHLTLFFVGAVERARLPVLERVGASIRGCAFDLVLERVGYFRRSGIVWAGTHTTPPALIDLATSLRAALAAAGVQGEDRPYVPHVTLVRDALRPPAQDVLEPCSSRAREFALVRSVPAASGVRYENIALWPLTDNSVQARRLPR